VKENYKNQQRFQGSLILHLRPLRVPASAIRYTHTFGLGGMALVLADRMIREHPQQRIAYDIKAAIEGR